MEGRQSGDLSKHLSSLFRDGTLTGVPDAQLLERMVAGRDDAGEMAFRALMRRHGPMVLRVCQSVLRDRHDAEDAFQVTFLVLIRAAGSIRKQHSLASWLHGVAHRVALRTRTATGRRRVHERKAAQRAEPVAPSQVPGEDRDDLRAVLHQEITRLPAKYRAPIVLCYLQGLTHDLAASELGWPVGTVRARLARARDLLRTRLTRRGLTLDAGLVATGALPKTASPPLSATLIEATVKAALGSTAAGVLAGTAALRLNAVLRNMALVRVGRLTVSLAMIALVAGGAAIFADSSRKKVSAARTPIARIEWGLPLAPTDRTDEPLPVGALARLGTTRFLHAASPTEIVYAPDGGTLASFDGDLHLWDPLTGRERRRIETGTGRGGGYVPFAYAPDSQSLAVQGDFRTNLTNLYDASSGREVRRFEGERTASCLAFSPDGKLLAGGFHDTPVILWEVASGRVLRRMGSAQLTSALAFSPDGNVLIACVPWLGEETPEPPHPDHDALRTAPLQESAIQVWEVASGKEINRIRMPRTRIKQAVLAPDGKTVATGATDKTIRLWDLANGRELRRFEGGDGEPGQIAFAPDGSKLASTEGEFTNFGQITPLWTPIHIWDTATGRELRRWETENDSCVCFSPDGTTLATVGSQVIRLWEVDSGREIRPQTGHRSAIGDAAFTPDGRTVVTAGHDRTIRFWDPATGKEIRRLEGSDGALRFAALSADGKTLATGYGFQPIRLWDVASGRALRRFQMPGKIDDQFVSCADLSPDGKTLATSRHEEVVFWDTATGKWRVGEIKSRIPPTNVTTLVKALRFAPDGASVATIAGDWVRIWNVATASETCLITMPNAPPTPPDGRRGPALDGLFGAHLAFSPDGAILAVSSQRDGVICLLDISSGRELSRLEGMTGYHTKAFAFSPDGTVLATGIDTGARSGRELSIRLWDVAAGRELGRAKAHRAEISALAFSPDGRRLVSASEDGTALVWDVAAVLSKRNDRPTVRHGGG